jgi:hypothetical protein
MLQNQLSSSWWGAQNKPPFYPPFYPPFGPIAELFIFYGFAITVKSISTGFEQTTPIYFYQSQDALGNPTGPDGVYVGGSWQYVYQNDSSAPHDTSFDIGLVFDGVNTNYALQVAFDDGANIAEGQWTIPTFPLPSAYFLVLFANASPIVNPGVLIPDPTNDAVLVNIVPIPPPLGPLIPPNN